MGNRFNVSPHSGDKLRQINEARSHHASPLSRQEEALSRMERAYENGFNRNPEPTSLRHINDLRSKLGLPGYGVAPAG